MDSQCPKPSCSNNHYQHTTEWTVAILSITNMTTRIRNSDMHKYTSGCQTFQNNNETAWGEHKGDLYIVYSYGYHFPMYIYDYKTQEWYGNEDKYSSTTSRHQSQARPRNVNITYFDTSMMKAIVNAGGYNQTILERIAA
jgi:hypothetical protein